jgi:hypothetical protein
MFGDGSTPLTLRNNLFFGGILYFKNFPTNSVVQDNMFDQTGIVEYDFILTITGAPGGDICLLKVTRFIRWLHEQCGFQFGLVTADMYQSQQILQELAASGIKTARLSVDSTPPMAVRTRLTQQPAHTLAPSSPRRANSYRPNFHPQLWACSP